MEFILASSSPQRSALLKGLGMKFIVVPSAIEESARTEIEPKKRAQILARLKAQDVAKKYSGWIVIGCDTLVVTESAKLLEKPKDEKEARWMLGQQSGKTSVIHSALCVVDAQGRLHEGVSSSTVLFKKLTEQEVDWWIAMKLWKDRSGAFQIDGPGQLMIERIEGDFTGVVGLPLFLLGKLLHEAGVKLTIDN